MRMIGLLFLALPLSAQDDRARLEEVLKEHGPALKQIDGVIDVSAGGTAEEPRIVVRISREEARAAVKEKFGAAVGGFRLFVYVSSPVGQTVEGPKPADPPGKTPVPKPDPERDRPTLENCDILRDHLKLKPVTHHKNGKTVEGCQLMKRHRIGGGGGHSFWYTRHRTECPLRSNRLEKPAKADEFTEWVFTRGFQPAKQGSFLVFELKGSDKLWFEQVKEDLTSLLPYIREGARWVAAKEEDAGAGWKWEVPK